MRVLFSLLIILAPVSAFALSAADKNQIADQLSKTYPQITVTVETQPVISGDKDPALFRISPSGKANHSKLFLEGRYDIIINRPSDNLTLGTYLCDLADEFVKEQRKTKTSFLPQFQFKVGASAGPVNFEISGDRETLRGIVNSVMSLWDTLKDDYKQFNLFVRGYADRGGSFRRQMLETHPIRDISYFPLADPADRLLTHYVRKPASKKIGDFYTNADLPNLRAAFFKGAMDRFLNDCRLSRPLTPEAVILEGAVIDVNAPDHRSIDLYFYAYR